MDNNGGPSPMQLEGNSEAQHDADMGAGEAQHDTDTCDPDQSTCNFGTDTGNAGASSSSAA
eukprot:7539794-Alexandrium_andersonii.AAC.1